MLKLSIAGLIVGVDNKYAYTSELCRDYLTDSGEVDLAVSATADDLKKEAEGSDRSYSEAYLESIAIYRKIAEKIPEFDGIVFHGAVIALEGKAYAVTAKSGVGKTTHISIWLREFGSEVHILNGDKPILRVINGEVYAAGTPWRGKENFGISEMLPLCGIAFLERAEKSSCEPIGISEALVPFINQIYVPKSESTAPLALSVANKIISSVPMLKLRADMSPEAARIAREAFQSISK